MNPPVLERTTSAKKLGLTEWLIIFVAILGFAFDTYELLMLPLIARPALIELLRVLLKQRCEDFQVAQKLVASADDLEAIAADDGAPIRALHGWRREVFGRDALALKHGELALTAGKSRIELVPLPERGEA